ncbi:hypothetical protein CH63R_11384 [Colletotrichum higginsianum IMI 349063]|uniref:Uncharacterized protein n=1 Tax=Colletotrichum higginsianum (strain IMI 349063) TaxID=759273 RepID=A0A1B7XY69_COLHI|nr:hypothetical protein CH63R_11384 [Colletotrichum higginsianum IMI 349063]OBR04681.1 hypothetical protein CH63R_11384 [Colletotrichum higginsianum IMI 349063]
MTSPVIIGWAMFCDPAALWMRRWSRSTEPTHTKCAEPDVTPGEDLDRSTWADENPSTVVSPLPVSANWQIVFQWEEKDTLESSPLATSKRFGRKQPETYAGESWFINTNGFVLVNSSPRYYY